MLMLRAIPAWMVAALAATRMVPAFGQAIETHAAKPSDALSLVRPGERLSDWLLRQPLPIAGLPEFGPGLMWMNPGEQASQQALKSRTMRALMDDRQPGVQALAAWVRAMPATGRVVLGAADARWLQANPSQDPVLRQSDQVKLQSMPATVTVVGADGARCTVRHRPRLWAGDYATACGRQAHARDGRTPAMAWVAQPDGQTFQVGTAPWSLNDQPHPAPGSWIVVQDDREGPPWAPLLARFLATQGPSSGVDGTVGTNALPIEARPRHPLGDRPRSLQVTASDWGEVGLLQTPTARMGPAGTFRFHWSRVWPYTRGTVMLQPFDWLEGGFRYTDVANRLYGPLIAGDQSFKDKSIDFKLRLLQEDTWWPQISLGMRDLGGTGLFSGEYLVGSKRHGDLDFSLGLGWGYLGARGDLGNPLSMLHDGFSRRPGADNPSGGTVNVGSVFRGRTALFGGVQWHTPWRAWWLKAEVEGNDYRSEPQGNRQPQSTPLNLGVVWRPRPGFDFAAGWERGRELMLSLTMETNLEGLAMPKTMDPPLPRPSGAAPQPQGKSLAEAIELHTGWQVARLDADRQTLHVHFSEASGAYRMRAVERVAHLLDATLPERFDRFVLHFGQRSLDELNLMVVDRRALRTQRTEAKPPSAAPEVFWPAPVGSIASAGDTWWEADRSRARWWVSPSFGYILGGPDNFLLYQIGATLNAQWPLNDATWVSGTGALRVLDNYDNFKYTGPSLLPRVRTYQREFVTSQRLTLPKLQLSHLRQLNKDHSFLAYGGLMESMYAGVGAEWMWRPARSRLALGLDVNRVRQRGFNQDFSLRDYEVNTGHLTAYWNTPWQGVGVTLSAGQYLAGDRGATLELTRTFGNGVVMGAYATKTNVSAAQFGEGSFDKGIFLSLPVDAILPRTTNRFLNVLWAPLTRDGGAKLGRSETLYRLTRLADSEAFRHREALKASRFVTGENVFAP